MSLANLSVNTKSPGSLRGSWLKRRPDSENDDDDEGSSTKIPRYSYYVTLESESPQPTDEDEESVYSVQGKETDYVADTSDTSTHTWVSSSSSSDGGDLSLRVEYEVASLSEGPNPFDNDGSSSDVSDIVAMGVLTFCDSDLGLADNSNDSRSSVDSEIGTADYWTCVQCNTTNNNPLFRYCEKCYQIRKNFFPPRPKWRKSRRQTIPCQGNPYGLGLEQARFTQELTSADSGLGSSQDSKCSLQVDLTLDAIKLPSGGVAAAATPSAPGSPSLSSSLSKECENTAVNLATNRGNDTRSRGETFNGDLPSIENRSSKYRDKNIDMDKLCIVCTAAPKNGAFVHGAVTHICCCYRCAVKVWSKTRRCPICNRKVTNVLKAFYT